MVAVKLSQRQQQPQHRFACSTVHDLFPSVQSQQGLLGSVRIAGRYDLVNRSLLVRGALQRHCNVLTMRQGVAYKIMKSSGRLIRTVVLPDEYPMQPGPGPYLVGSR